MSLFAFTSIHIADILMFVIIHSYLVLTFNGGFGAGRAYDHLKFIASKLMRPCCISSNQGSVAKNI